MAAGAPSDIELGQLQEGTGLLSRVTTLSPEHSLEDESNDELRESEVTAVPNNGHATAAYVELSVLLLSSRKRAEDRAGLENDSPIAHTIREQPLAAFSSTPTTASVPGPAHNTVASPVSRTRRQRAWWWWELAAAMLSNICIALIFLTFAITHGKPLTTWTLPIFPNAVVSVLATIAKSALTLLVAESISQLKWLYFESAQRLRDLDAFDGASRGPWGAAMSMWSTKGKAWTATSACFVTVAALGFEPAAQQIFPFPTRSGVRLNGTARFGITSKVQLKDIVQ
ncbi:hypothetical protein LTS18_006703, partial [Coniosporium uncinatum]